MISFLKYFWHIIRTIPAPKFHWQDNQWPTPTQQGHWVTIPNPNYRKSQPITDQQVQSLLIATMTIDAMENIYHG